MSNTLYEDRQILTLNILDEGMREGMPIEVATSLPAAHVIRMLEYAMAWRSQPQAIRLDNGLEIIMEHFMTGAAERAIELRHKEPQKPDQNAFIERSNGHVAPKCSLPTYSSL